MKKTLGIIGIGLIAGVAVYELLNKAKKTKDDATTKAKKDAVDVSSDNSTTKFNPNNVYSDSDELGKVKFSTINTMSSRHEEASKIMKDAVEIICKRSEITEDENRDLDEISDSLDELLGDE